MGLFDTTTEYYKNNILPGLNMASPTGAGGYVAPLTSLDITAPSAMTSYSPLLTLNNSGIYTLFGLDTKDWLNSPSTGTSTTPTQSPDAITTIPEVTTAAPKKVLPVAWENTKYGQAAKKYGLNSIDEVKNIQRLMKAAGVYTGEIDGDFGPASIRAYELMNEKYSRQGTLFKTDNYLWKYNGNSWSKYGTPTSGLGPVVSGTRTQSNAANSVPWSGSSTTPTQSPSNAARSASPTTQTTRTQNLYGLNYPTQSSGYNRFPTMIEGTNIPVAPLSRTRLPVSNSLASAPRVNYSNTTPDYRFIPNWTLTRFNKQGGILMNYYQQGGSALNQIETICLALAQDPEGTLQALLQLGADINQVLQVVALAAQKGSKSAQAAIQALLPILQGAAKKAEQGAKLDYIRLLKGQCPEGTTMRYFKLAKGGVCKKCIKSQDGIELNKKEVPSIPRKEQRAPQLSYGKTSPTPPNTSTLPLEPAYIPAKSSQDPYIPRGPKNTPNYISTNKDKPMQKCGGKTKKCKKGEEGMEIMACGGKKKKCAKKCEDGAEMMACGGKKKKKCALGAALVAKCGAKAKKKKCSSGAELAMCGGKTKKCALGGMIDLINFYRCGGKSPKKKCEEGTVLDKCGGKAKKKASCGTKKCK